MRVIASTTTTVPYCQRSIDRLAIVTRGACLEMPLRADSNIWLRRRCGRTAVPGLSYMSYFGTAVPGLSYMSYFEGEVCLARSLISAHGSRLQKLKPGTDCLRMAKEFRMVMKSATDSIRC